MLAALGPEKYIGWAASIIEMYLRAASPQFTILYRGLVALVPEKFIGWSASGTEKYTEGRLPQVHGAGRFLCDYFEDSCFFYFLVDEC